MCGDTATEKQREEVLLIAHVEDTATEGAKQREKKK
jgi:hypothetical protein